jgi:hypothetical protein
MLSLALILATAAAAPAQSVASSYPATCTVAAVRFPQPTRGSRRFSASRIIDIEFELLSLARPGEAERLALKVFTPNGHLYEALTPAVTTAGRGEDGGRGWRLRARLPVAGTTIVTSSLYGRWSVVPYLGGTDEPCGRPLSFWIDP